MFGVLCLLGVLSFWRWGGQRQARRENPIPATRAEARLGTVRKTQSASPIQLLSLGVSSQPSEKTNQTARTRYPYRLNNTTKTVDELAHSDKAILLANALLDTSKDFKLTIPAHLRAPENNGSYVVQSRGPLSDSFRAVLKNANATIISYIPNNAYLVLMPAESAKQLVSNSRVQTVLDYEPYYKLEASLLKLAVEQKPLPENSELKVTLFPGTQASAKADLQKLGVIQVNEERSPFGPVVTLRAPPNTLADIARIPVVQLVEASHPRISANDLSRTRLGVSRDTITNFNYLGLTGSNILININDSGVDRLHPDLTNRVTGDLNLSLSDTDGHGTHVAGTIAGSGVMSSTVINAIGSITNTANFRGMAPAAKLYSISLDIDRGAASDAYLQEQAAKTNAFISNNSWNYVGAADYTIEAASYDAAVRDALPLVSGSHPQLFVFSAGNGGNGDDAGLSGDPQSILSPATAKNVITVGAIEQSRNITNNVVKRGVTSKPFLPSSNSSNQVASFSSRGNVGIGIEGEAGRFKPDVVAPGTFLVSARSGQWDTNAYYNHTTNYHYNTYFNQSVETNSLEPYSIFIPDNAIQVIIEVFSNERSPSPFPTNTPIYVRYGDNPTFATFDFKGTNRVSSPPDFAFNRETTLFYSIGNGTAQALHYDVQTTLVTTNDFGNYYEVLHGLNDDLGPFYRYESGTSMAAAGVTGFLALMQEFFEQRAHVTNSPALMKALLINGSRSVSTLYDIQVGSSINYQGWGLPALSNSIPGALTNLATPGPLTANLPVQFFDQHLTNALATGQSKTRTLALTPSGRGRPLRMTLVWTDPPGNPAAGVKLVNDLDLIVTNLTTGDVYYGNDIPAGSDFSEPWDTNSAPIIDVVNNVENIYLPSPLGSNYSVTVFGKRVNVNAITANTNNIVQDYALVISSGDAGTVSNAFTLTDVPLVSTNLAHVISMTNGLPLLGQRVGANSQYSVSTNGVVSQWNFYIYTNTTAFTNVAFVTFLPPNMGLTRMGTRVGDPTDAARVEADLDMYVSTNPALTNLDQAAIGAALESRTRTGTEKVLLSNSVPNQVYYIGIKSEDQEGAEYAFLAAASQLPFGQRDGNGNIPMIVLTALPATIPDGSPALPGFVSIVAVTADNSPVRRVIVTNSVTHENFGDLIGTLSFGKHLAVLNNHSFFDNGSTSETFIYDDSEEGDIPGSRASDGPGTLQNFVGDKAGDGVWILNVVDDSLTQTGQVISPFGITIEPTPPTNGVLQTIGAHRPRFYPIDVPPNATNLTITVLSNSFPLNLYLRHGSRPAPRVGLPTAFDKSAIAPAGGGSLSLTIYDNPPLSAGRYYLEIYNDNPVSQTFFGPIISIGLDLAPATPPRFVGSGPIPILDDAVTYATNFVALDKLIVDTEVGVRIDHPRVSDLALTLISPHGTRVLLAENRGGLTTNGFGAGVNVTNVFPQTTAGTAAEDTQVLTNVLNSGTILISYDFRGIADSMHIYYDGVLIFDSGLIPGSGTFTIDYGPGVSQNVVIIMNEGGNHDPGTMWTYSATVISRGIAYATFSENTNKALIPIKFATPPFGTNTTGLGNPVSDFEGITMTNGARTYFAGGAPLPDGWTVVSNKVTVQTDPLLARSGTNFLNLRDGRISRFLPTVAGTQYKLQFSYRRAPALEPLHWWPGNSNTVDLVSGNDGVWFGTNTYEPMEVGLGFSIEDASTNYVRVLGDPSLNIGAGPGFTIDSWINVDEMSMPRPLIEWNDGLGFDDGAHFGVGPNPGGGGTGALYANLVDIFGVPHFISSPAGVLSSNVNHHVALTYDKTTATNQFGTNVDIVITKLFVDGTVVTNVTNDVFVAETSLDLYFGQQIAGSAAGKRIGGELDEIGFYGSALTDAQIQDIFAAGSEGRSGTLNPPSVSPPVQANVFINGIPVDMLTAKAGAWTTESLTFIATGNGTPLEIAFTNCPSGMLLDSFSLIEPGQNNFYFPEESLDKLQGESAKGNWVLEIVDNRVGATNPPPELKSWQLSFDFETTAPAAIPLAHAIPNTNTVAVNDIRYFVVNVPVWAKFATNLVTADGAINLLFNQSILPSTTNSTDVTLFGPTLNGSRTLTTNGPTPLLQPGQHYYLGVQNVSGAPVNFSIEVDFDIRTLTNAIPVTNSLPIGNVPRYYQFDVSTNATAVAFEILKTTGNVDLVVRKGAPLPDLNSFDYISNNPGSNSEAIVVTTNSPVVLTAGRWYLGVFNRDTTNVTYVVRATENGLTNIITLDNGVPFPWSATPGVALNTFFRFVADHTNSAVVFEVYANAGDVDLTLQRDRLPLTPPFFDGSFRSGTNFEQIVIRTNILGTNINAQWFLGVPNNEITNVSYTIRAVVSTNGMLISGIPINVTVNTPPSPATNGPTLTWPSIPGETYQIQTSTNIIVPFMPLTNIVANGSSTIFIDPTPIAGIPMLFYRIVQIPTP
ncbi:MAG: Peptidase and in kexin sedolisin [Pedosphaera sp.]|nr:Peptidase and in kexin sedolisin [Pedosphaera sp.]